MWDRLESQIDLEYEELRRLVQHFGPLLKKGAEEGLGDYETAAVAAMLQSFYNGVETCSKESPSRSTASYHEASPGTGTCSHEWPTRPIPARLYSQQRQPSISKSTSIFVISSDPHMRPSCSGRRSHPWRLESRTFSAHSNPNCDVFLLVVNHRCEQWDSGRDSAREEASYGPEMQSSGSVFFRQHANTWRRDLSSRSGNCRKTTACTIDGPGRDSRYSPWIG